MAELLSENYNIGTYQALINVDKQVAFTVPEGRAVHCIKRVHKEKTKCLILLIFDKGVCFPIAYSTNMLNHVTSIRLY